MNVIEQRVVTLHHRAIYLITGTGRMVITSDMDESR